MSRAIDDGSRSGASSPLLLLPASLLPSAAARPLAGARARDARAARWSAWSCPCTRRVSPAPHEPPRYPIGAARLEVDVFGPAAGVLTPQVGVSPLAEHESTLERAHRPIVLIAPGAGSRGLAVSGLLACRRRRHRRSPRPVRSRTAPSPHPVRLRTAPLLTCAGRAPRAVRLTRLPGPRVRLSWRAPTAPPGWAGFDRLPRAPRGAHRRADHAAPRWSSRSCPGGPPPSPCRPATPRAPQSAPPSCAARCALRPPGRVRGLRVLARTATGVRIGWRPAAPRRRARRRLPDHARRRRRRADPRARLHRSSSAPPALTASRSPPWTPAGAAGPPSRTLQDRRPPGRRLHAARWPPGANPPACPASSASRKSAKPAPPSGGCPASPGSARIIGYRVYRDGALLGQSTRTRCASPTSPRCAPT